jgi:hypothetical protein
MVVWGGTNQVGTGVHARVIPNAHLCRCIDVLSLYVAIAAHPGHRAMEELYASVERR